MPSGNSPSSSIDEAYAAGAGSSVSSALEVERARVDAVAQAGRVRAVVEDMAEVAAARRAHDLGANHPVARVGLRDDAVERRRLEEARPAAARLELRVRAEELRPAAGAAVDAVAVLVPVRAGERALRALAPQDLVLLGREALAPLLVGELDLGSMRRGYAPSSEHDERESDELRRGRRDDEQVEDLVEAERGRERVGPRRRVRERPDAVQGAADDHQHRRGDAERREELRDRG